MYTYESDRGRKRLQNTDFRVQLNPIRQWNKVFTKSMPELIDIHIKGHYDSFLPVLLAK